MMSDREAALRYIGVFGAARQARMLLYLVLVFFCAVALSLFIGRYPHGGFLPLSRLSSDELAVSVLVNLRFPRVLTAALLGTCLGASGMVFQMIFANPLVEPGFLGVSQGAAFGAGVAIVYFGAGGWLVQGGAAFFAFLGLVFSYLLARRIRFGGWILRLILSGIAVSALFSAGVGILKYVADPMGQLPEITFWLLGGLWGVSWPRLLSVAPAALAGSALILGRRWRLNMLALGDETVHSLGSAPARERVLLLAAAVASTASLISVCGVVAWIGLIVPHLSRRLFGVDTRYALPGSMLIGALFTLFCDDLSRVLFTAEIPLGILTSLIGAAFFLFLMTGRRRGVYR
jgi:iron complex transport system permease protein